MPVGRVGRPHGRDGSFYLEDASSALQEGALVTVRGTSARVERRKGTLERPLVRLSGVRDRDGAASLRGEALLVPEAEAPLAEGEWLADDLVGCTIEGLGVVRRVVGGLTCDLLEVGEQRNLIPLVSDAVRRIDVEARAIEVDRRFLGL